MGKAECFGEYGYEYIAIESYIKLLKILKAIYYMGFEDM